MLQLKCKTSHWFRSMHCRITYHWCRVDAQDKPLHPQAAAAARHRPDYSVTHKSDNTSTAIPPCAQQASALVCVGRNASNNWQLGRCWLACECERKECICLPLCSRPLDLLAALCSRWQRSAFNNEITLWLCGAGEGDFQLQREIALLVSGGGRW